MPEMRETLKTGETGDTLQIEQTADKWVTTCVLMLRKDTR